MLGVAEEQAASERNACGQGVVKEINSVPSLPQSLFAAVGVEALKKWATNGAISPVL
jgi:hypothetical protein